MDALSAALLPLLGYTDRVVRIYGHTPEITLRKPHTPAIFQIDRRYNDHLSTPNPNLLNFSPGKLLQQGSTHNSLRVSVIRAELRENPSKPHPCPRQLTPWR